MSTINSSTKVAIANHESWSAAAQLWFARRRITLSIACFASLIIVNLVILGTKPNNPFAFGEWKSVLGVALIALGVAIRSWSAGTIVKNDQLTTDGPYAIVRNPLYVGSFLMMFGFATLLNDIPTLIFISGPLSLMYWTRVRNEEKFLHACYGEMWTNYAGSTPRFVPYKCNPGWRSGWTFQQWVSNHEYQALLSAIAAVIGIAILYSFTA